MNESSRVGLFISHREEDSDVAQEIKKILNDYTGGLDVYTYTDTLGGEQWEKWIEEQLAKSQICLFLYTDPTAGWRWCFYEIGLFKKLDGGNKHRVICLHGSDVDHPGPLRSIITVPADPAVLVSKFLGPLYRSDELTGVQPPLNDTLSDDALKDAAERIAELIGPKRIDTRYYFERFSIDIDSQEEIIQKKRLREDVMLHAAEGKSAVFDLDYPSFSWKEIKERIAHQTGTYWMDEVEQAIVAIAEKRTPPVQTATFRSVQGGEIFRPIVYRADRKGSRLFKVYLALLQDLAPEKIGGTSDLDTLFNMLRIAHRSRWEIIEPFMNRLERTLDDTALHVICRQIAESVESILREAEKHGYLNEAVVAKACGPKSELEVKVIFETWGKIQSTLNKAIQKADAKKIKQCLIEMRKLNAKFVCLAGSRYSEIANEEAKGVS